MSIVADHNELSQDNKQDSEVQFQAADLIVGYLEQIGVEYVFGVPGGAIEPLYNAMARSQRRGGLRPIVARHESGAAFMADGYTRETGKLGVCCAIPGPGATNLITGVASAYVDNIPMLAITAQTSLHTFGRGAAQDSSCSGVNTLGMFEHCTRYNTLVSHIEQLEVKLIAAITTALQAPRGPAHLSIPLDILRGPMPYKDTLFPLDKLLHQLSLPTEEAVDALYQSISNAHNIVLLIGSGCGEAIGLILAFARLINASILTTAPGKGLVSSYHPQFKGVFGFAGHQSAYDLLTHPSVDLVLAIGTGLGELESSCWDEKAVLNERLIHIDSIVEHLVRSPMARMHVCGRIFTLFEQLLKRCHNTQRVNTSTVPQEEIKHDKPTYIERRRAPSLEEQSTIVEFMPQHLSLEDKKKYLDDSTPIKPQRLMRELSRRFPVNTRYFADSGNSFAWAIHFLDVLDRRVAGARPATCGMVRFALGAGAMTWAIGAAVGTAIGRRGVPVVCITGDGSFLMSGQEITVAVSEQLPVIFVVLNDSALGMVKHGQRLAGAEQVGFKLPVVDFCMLGRALGAEAHVIYSPKDFEKLDIKALCNRNGPTLLEVYVDPEEVPPMGMRIKGLNAAIN